MSSSDHSKSYPSLGLNLWIWNCQKVGQHPYSLSNQLPAVYQKAGDNDKVLRPMQERTSESDLRPEGRRMQ